MEIQENRTGSEAEAWAPGSLLHALADPDRHILLELGNQRWFQPGEALMTEGSPGSDLFVLVRGYVKVLGNTVDGRAVLVSVRVAGDLVGELAALDDRPRSASVIAATQVLAGAISRPAFTRYLDDHPQAARAVHAGVVGELRRLTRHRIDFSGASIAVRLAIVLTELVETYGCRCPDGVRIEVPLSQPELASLVGVSEPSLHRALADLRTKGVILTRYRRLTVRDPATLRLLAEDRYDSGTTEPER